jgi:hypothetical protein
MKKPETQPSAYCNKQSANWMFRWPCIVVHVYQYWKTNVMHFLFSLLKIKGLYMLRASLAHLQEALHKRHLIYWVRMSVGCATSAVPLKSWHSQLTLYARNISSAVCSAPPENQQAMLEICRGPWFSINWMKSASRWFYYTDKKSGFPKAFRRHLIKVLRCRNILRDVSCMTNTNFIEKI